MKVSLEASAVHAEEFQKGKSSSIEKNESFSKVDNAASNNCTVDVGIQRCRAKQYQNGESFCTLNQQDSSAVDSFIIAVDGDEVKLKVSSPNELFPSTNMADTQREPFTGFLPQKVKCLADRIILPPKKRTCLNREINGQPTGILTILDDKETLLPSNLAAPETFRGNNGTLGPESITRTDLQIDSVDEARRKIIVESSGSSAKYMKPSKLLLRRYKLLSEIV